MADIELVEDEHGPREPTADGVDPTASGGPAHPRRRRGRRYALGAAGALVVGLVATQVVVDAREYARATRLTDVAGLLAPLEPDARLLWRSSPDDATGFPLGALPVAVDGVLVTGAVDADGTVRLGAVDPETGRRLWSTTAAAPSGPPQEGPLGSVTCRSAATPGRPEPGGTTAACTVEVPTEVVELGGAASSTLFAVSSTALLMVDPATGEVAHRVDPPPGTDVRDAPGGYLTATQDTDGGLTVARYTWGSTTPTWTVSTGPPAAVGLGSTAPTTQLVGADPITMLVDAQHVALSRAGAAWLLDASDGSLLDASSGTPGTDATILLPHGGFLASWFDGSGPTSRMVAADGTVAVLPGTLGPVPLVDDGSAAEVVLAAEASRTGSPLALVALDARTGERRWRSGARFGWSIVILDGVAYTSDGGDLVAVDLQDGSVRWTRRIERSETRLLTDGTAAILVGQGRVDAYDLRDGAPLWSSVVVRTDDSVRLQPVTGGPTAGPTVTDGTTDTSSWATTIGRHLALVSPSGEITVLG